MKKSVKGFLLFFSLVLLVAVPFASASFFGNLFGKITGDVISTSCEDTDGGVVSGVRGSLIIEGKFIGQDYCYGDYVAEYYCSDVKEYSFSWCENGCHDGRCLDADEVLESGKCADSDVMYNGGNYPNYFGVLTFDGVRNVESCYDSLEGNSVLEGSVVLEYYCNGNSLESRFAPCEYGCFQGHCLTVGEGVDCVDEDNSYLPRNDPYYEEYGYKQMLYSFNVEGTYEKSSLFLGGDLVGEDKCYNSNMLVEYVCQPNVLQGYLEKIHYCEYGCLDGACLKTSQVESEVSSGFDSVCSEENGFVSYNSSSYAQELTAQDYCINDYQLRNFYCLSDNSGIGESYSYCTKGCDSETGSCFESSLDSGSSTGKISSTENFEDNSDLEGSVLEGDDLGEDENELDDLESEGCIDSDGGNNLLIKGTAKSISFGEWTDYCYGEDGRRVMEFQCKDDERVYSSQLYCPSGTSCYDGACLTEEEKEKSASDYCGNDFCGAEEDCILCEDDCGVCLDEGDLIEGGEIGEIETINLNLPECEDEDGENIYLRSQSFYFAGGMMDSCEVDEEGEYTGYLLEGICGENGFESERIECELGCENGACLEREEVYSCFGFADCSDTSQDSCLENNFGLCSWDSSKRDYSERCYENVSSSCEDLDIGVCGFVLGCELSFETVFSSDVLNCEGCFSEGVCYEAGEGDSDTYCPGEKMELVNKKNLGSYCTEDLQCESDFCSENGMCKNKGFVRGVADMIRSFLSLDN